MIMGADVTHPASDFKGGKPSIAAIAGSMDPRASQYACEIRFQVGFHFKMETSLMVLIFNFIENG